MSKNRERLHAHFFTHTRTHKGRDCAEVQPLRAAASSHGGARGLAFPARPIACTSSYALALAVLKVPGYLAAAGVAAAACLLAASLPGRWLVVAGATEGGRSCVAARRDARTSAQEAGACARASAEQTRRSSFQRGQERSSMARDRAQLVQ